MDEQLEVAIKIISVVVIVYLILGFFGVYFSDTLPYDFT